MAVLRVLVNLATIPVLSNLDLLMNKLSLIATKMDSAWREQQKKVYRARKALDPENARSVGASAVAAAIRRLNPVVTGINLIIYLINLSNIFTIISLVFCSNHGAETRQL